MARRRKNSLIKQLTIVGAILAACQLGYLFLIPRPQPVSIKEAIQTQLDKQSVDEKRKEQLRVQLSVADFQQKQSKLPDNLQELVPVYFDEVPKVPGTSDPFEYYVTNGKYYVGDKPTIVALQSGTTPAKPGQGGVFLKADSTVPLTATVQKALIDSLKDEGALQQVATVYDSTGKRDPFRPFDFAPAATVDESKTPLERYDVNQLKLTAVLSGAAGEPTATVENAAGKGFIVKKGIKIGLNNGEVVDIKPDRLIVIETTVDFTGQKKTKTIELRLRTKDQEDNRIRKGL